MTEHEWLTSDDPAALWQHVRDRATPAQRDAFVLACRSELWSLTDTTVRAPWIPQTVETVMQHLNESQAGRGRVCAAAILRDIFGNPYRPIRVADMKPEHRLVMDPNGAVLVADRNRLPIRFPKFEPSAPSLCEEVDGIEVQTIPTAWLAWNDGAVPKLAASIASGQRCGQCKWFEKITPYGREQGWQYADGWEKCSHCHGTGRTPPSFEDMPILADALFEASDGRAPKELLNHLRGMERIPMECKHNGTATFNDLAAMNCKSCHGTGKIHGLIPLRGPHTTACWALRLLSNHSTNTT